VDTDLIIGLLSVGTSWVTKKVVESVSRNRDKPLPSWLDEVAAGIAAVVFSVAATRVVSRLKRKSS